MADPGPGRRWVVPANPSLRLHHSTTPQQDTTAPQAPGAGRLSAEPETIPVPSAVYTADQVAALLQIERRTLERWTSAGKVPGRLKLPGRAVRYRRDVIDQW